MSSEGTETLIIAGETANAPKGRVFPLSKELRDNLGSSTGSFDEKADKSTAMSDATTGIADHVTEYGT